MGFFTLNPRDDVAKWANLVDMLPAHLRDVHFSPEFMAAQEMLGHQPRLAVYTYVDYVVLQPIIIRDIEINGKWTGYRDIASAVGGFGGPASNHHTLYDWFSESFMSWCRENKIVSEFCALHPMLQVHQTMLLDRTIELRERKLVVVINLETDYAARYHDNRRQGIEKAHRAGVKVVTAGGVQSFNSFVGLYRDAMVRKQAAERWYFPDEYLRAVCAAGTVFYALAPDGSIESAALMLARGHNAHYHMAANSMRNPKLGANEFLVDEIAKGAKELGCRWLHLGGGVTSAEDDPVLFFKAGFSDLRRPALSYFRVFDPSAYKALCAAKAEDEVDKTGAEFATSFEPMYRREMA